MNADFYSFERIFSSGFYSRTRELEGQGAYYAVVVEERGRRFLEVLQREVGAAFTECEKRFFVHEALNVLEQQLERTALLLADHQLDVDLASIDSHLRSFSSYQGRGVSLHVQVGEGTSILLLLKGVLISLYLQVQEQFKRYVQRNVLTLEAIHRVFFGEDVPETSCVVKLDRDCGVGRDGAVNRSGKVVAGGAAGEVGCGEMVAVEPVEGYEEKGFEAVMGDVRPVVEGVLAYGSIVKDPARFARLEVVLFEQELIDAHYRFRKKPHGNVTKMAAVYWVAYEMGYLQKYYFQEKRKVAVTTVDVRQFFNHRYQTHIERQFQTFGKPDILHDYLRSQAWFSLITRS